jgi:hypothetical protein
MEGMEGTTGSNGDMVRRYVATVSRGIEGMWQKVDSGKDVWKGRMGSVWTVECVNQR